MLEKLEEQTGQIAGNLKLIAKQNELEQLDREWAMTQEGLMVSGKNGNYAPSAVGGVVTMAIAVVFGGFWTATAAKMGAPAIMVLFGVVFILVGVVAGLTSMTKAGELDTKRSAYENRRQQLIAAIEAEKRV